MKTDQMEPMEAYRRAMETRGKLVEQARSIGITEELIDLLVDQFYGKVQNHPDLGPVFNDAIQDRWPIHLAKMKVFWKSLAFRTGEYEGQPMRVHRALTAAQPEHFDIWLKLFEETLREIAPNEAVVEYFLSFAKTMAARFKRGMFSSAAG